LQLIIHGTLQMPLFTGGILINTEIIDLFHNIAVCKCEGISEGGSFGIKSKVPDVS